MNEGNERLRECPFCGLDDRLSLQNLVDEDDFSVCCERCDVTQHAIHTEPAAIAAWNRRAALSPDLEAEEIAMKAAFKKHTEEVEHYEDGSCCFLIGWTARRHFGGQS